MDYIFFFGAYNPNGYLSNHSLKGGFVIDGIRYKCVEQYMMAEKARLFNDTEAEKQIMATTDPAKMKRAGRAVHNFKPDIWDQHKENIVETAVTEKFKQNPELREMLSSTGDAVLVEANPYDKIWGIGMSEADAKRNRSSWGQNLLGKILMRVREKLSSEHEAEG